jgi:hypothetical protein
VYNFVATRFVSICCSFGEKPLPHDANRSRLFRRITLVSRRNFLQTMAAGTATAALSSTARSYAQIVGSNERLNFAVIGLNGRAYAHLSSLHANSDHARITHVCDVESNILAKFAAATEKKMGTAPATEKDFRRLLERKDIDAITIATPDHWHAPMAIAGVEAGKHVYVEKPCSHNPAEGVSAHDRDRAEDP